MINFLHLGLSYKCNLRCKHCFVFKSKDMLCFEDFKNIIDVLCRNGLISVIYTYGEPLLAPDFFEVCEYASQKRLMQILMTNGTIITPKTAARIKQSNINFVYVSLDHSTPEKHDKNRGVAGAYVKALNAVKLLQTEGVNVGFSVTVTNENVDDLDNIYALAQKLQVKNISFLTERNNKSAVEFYKPDKYYSFFEQKLASPGSVKLVFHDARLNDIIKRLFADNKITAEQMDYYLDMNKCKNQYTLCIHPSGDMSRCNFAGRLNYNYTNGDFEKYIQSEEFAHENPVCHS